MIKSKKTNSSKASTKAFKMMLMEVSEDSLSYPQIESKLFKSSLGLSGKWLVITQPLTSVKFSLLPTVHSDPQA